MKLLLWVWGGLGDEKRERVRVCGRRRRGGEGATGAERWVGAVLQEYQTISPSPHFSISHTRNPPKPLPHGNRFSRTQTSTFPPPPHLGQTKPPPQTPSPVPLPISQTKPPSTDPPIQYRLFSFTVPFFAHLYRYPPFPRTLTSPWEKCLGCEIASIHVYG